MQQLKRDVVRGFVVRLITLSLIVFLSAGTFAYWQGWVFIVVFHSCNLLLTTYLWKNNKGLLRQRVYSGYRYEREKVQKTIVLLLSISSIAQVICSALDHRLNLYHPAPAWVMGGNILIVTGTFITFLVFRENCHASATVQAHADQTIVASGPYAIVRHPMYAGGILTFCGIPLALASYAGLAFGLIIAPILIARLRNEEAVLLAKVPAYRTYQLLTPWRLLPGIY